MKPLIILCLVLFVVQTVFADQHVPSEYARAVNQIDKELAELNYKREELTFRIDVRRRAVDDFRTASAAWGKIYDELRSEATKRGVPTTSPLPSAYETLCDRLARKRNLTLSSSGISLSRCSDYKTYYIQSHERVAEIGRELPALEHDLDAVVDRIGKLEADRQKLLGGINSNPYVQAITGRWYLDWNTSVITVHYDTRTKDFVGVLSENDFAYFNNGDVLFHVRFDKAANGKPVFIGVMFGRPDGKRKDEMITLVVNGDKIDYQIANGDSFILYRHPPF